jgi:serine-type D-Ala-D-Ala carboxypeptidase/endopeptidase (penicillin-binding protein 4)
MQKLLLFFLWVMLVLQACTPAKQLSSSVYHPFLSDSAFEQAHMGVAVFDATEGKWLLQQNSRKYFVPASNIKLPTLYAGLKYLGDSLVSFYYQSINDTIHLLANGDPSFLHPDFTVHPSFEFLKQQKVPVVLHSSNWKTEPLGYGWSWSDYLSAYAAERSPLPVYGNVVTWYQERLVEQRGLQSDTSFMLLTDPEVQWEVKFSTEPSTRFRVVRPRSSNYYTIEPGLAMKDSLEVPFVTDGFRATLDFLKDTLYKELMQTDEPFRYSRAQAVCSQPADSLFKIMMHRSDNFFAEQVLLMVSNQLLGSMDEQRLIDTLLKTTLSGFPQQPRWVDGSGLSRYNLFSPEDFVWLLAKLKDEFSLERIKAILPAGNKGTLRNYYVEEGPLIAAKTGTLSGCVALSGYLMSDKGHLLLFSVLVNNHNRSAASIRRAVERLLKEVKRRN